MTPISPTVRAILLGAGLLLPSLAVAQTSDPRPPMAATTAPMPQPALPGTSPTGATAPQASRAMPTHAGVEQRTSKIVGSGVHNEAGASIGTVDDLVLGSGGNPTTAILSVGGFLGIGSRLVAVPLSELRYDQPNNRWTLPGASRDALMARPVFTYDARG